MAFKVRNKSTQPADIRRTLNRTKLNQDDPPLYQTINEVITRLEFDRDLLDNKFGKNDKIDAKTQINGLVPINNGGGFSGVYNPVTANVANVSGLEWDLFQYFRIGDVVFVSGKIRFNTVTAVGVDTKVAFSLPILSYFDFEFQCAGTGYSDEVNQGAAIRGDVTNQRAELRFLSSTNGAFTMYFQFSYRIIAQ